MPTDGGNPPRANDPTDDEQNMEAARPPSSWPPPSSSRRPSTVPPQQVQSRPMKRGDGWTLRIDALGRIRLDFFGPTTTEALRHCIAALDEAMPPEGEVDLVIDLLRLVGHNPESRDIWKDWLRRNKHQLNQVLMVIPSSASLIKMVAAAVGLAVGVRLRVSDQLP